MLFATVLGVLLLHGVALGVFSQLLAPHSQLARMAPPMYTRMIEAQTAPAPVTTAAMHAPHARPARPQAILRQDPQPTPGNRQARRPAAKALPEPAAEPIPDPIPAPEPTASAPAAVASAPVEPEPSTQAAPEPEVGLAGAQPSTTDITRESAASQAPIEAQAPGVAESAPPTPAFLAQWPADTRLSYRLGGNYRGELHGKAEVLWQHEGTRYQAVVELNVGFLLSSRFTSQGEITAAGLRPEIYEEQVRQRRRTVRLGEDVRLNDGRHVPRPDGVQDAASQFVELSQRFATGRTPLRPGESIRLWLARPGGVDEWTYDVVGEETLYLPRLGAVAAMHLKPQPIAQPRGPIHAEIWFAPALQYLPARIVLRQGEDTWIDLLVDTIEQQ